MEFEEKNPTDILLNEKEIKQETDNFLEEFQDVPFEYTELKPKDTLVDREIKQETVDFLQNVKEEPIDEDEYSEPIIQKQETEESLESFKKEPTDEEYSEQIILKLEENREQVSQEFYVKSQFPTPETSSANNPKKFQKTRNYWCPVCSKLEKVKRMKQVSLEDEELIIMIGCVLRGSHTIDEAKQLLSQENKPHICCIHFSDTIDEIYKVLDIKNPAEIYLCSVDMINNLMITVNTLRSETTKSQFCEMLYYFIQRYRSTQESNIKKDQNQRIYNSRCPVCSQLENVRNMKQVNMEDEKLILMIGCVLRGSHTIDQAQRFLSQKTRPNICYIHFSEIIDEVFNLLNIENTDEIYSCSVEMVSNLMITINALRSEILISQFFVMLNGFIARNCPSRINRHTKKRDSSKRHYKCSVCTQMKIAKVVKHVSMDDDRLVILIGCVLRADFTIEQAQQFLSEKKR